MGNQCSCFLRDSENEKHPLVSPKRSPRLDDFDPEPSKDEYGDQKSGNSPRLPLSATLGVGPPEDAADGDSSPRCLSEPDAEPTLQMLDAEAQAPLNVSEDVSSGARPSVPAPPSELLPVEPAESKVKAEAPASMPTKAPTVRQDATLDRGETSVAGDRLEQFFVKCDKERLGSITKTQLLTGSIGNGEVRRLLGLVENSQANRIDALFEADGRVTLGALRIHCDELEQRQSGTATKASPPKRRLISALSERSDATPTKLLSSKSKAAESSPLPAVTKSWAKVQMSSDATSPTKVPDARAADISDSSPERRASRKILSTFSVGEFRKRLFNACDVNGRGRLTAEELLEGLAANVELATALDFSTNPDRAWLDGVLSKLELAADVSLTLDNFEDLCCNVQVDILRKFFSKCDVFKTGTLGQADFLCAVRSDAATQRVLQLQQPLSSIALNELFELAAGEDGLLEFEELEAYYHSVWRQSSPSKARTAAPSSECAPPKRLSTHCLAFSTEDHRRKFFDACDAKKRGKISLAELLAGVTANAEMARQLHFQVEPTPHRAWCERVMPVCPASDDEAVLSFDAFVEFCLDVQVDILKRFFSKCDRCKLGSLGHADLVAGLRDNAEARIFLRVSDTFAGDELEELFNADTDGDGLISFDELKAHHAQLWRPFSRQGSSATSAFSRQGSSATSASALEGPSKRWREYKNVTLSPEEQAEVLKKLFVKCDKFKTGTIGLAELAEGLRADPDARACLQLSDQVGDDEFVALEVASGEDGLMSLEELQAYCESLRSA